jgi:hypothetical protein
MKSIKIYYRLLSVISCFIILTFSCVNKKNVEKWRYVEIYSRDKSQVITVITLGDKRYLMDGKHKKIPNDGYLLLDISEVDHLGDGISVCWNESGYK